MYHSFFIHSSVDRLWDCSVSWLINHTAVNLGVQVSFLIMIFSGYMPSRGISGSYCGSSCSCLRNLYIDYISLHSQQQCKRAPFSSHLLEHLLLVDFFFFLWWWAILTHIMWYLIVVLTCISLIVCNVEHLFMFLSAIWDIYFGLPPIFRSGCLFFGYWAPRSPCYILDIGLLSVAAFPNSPPLFCFFSFWSESSCFTMFCWFLMYSSMHQR